MRSCCLLACLIALRAAAVTPAGIVYEAEDIVRTADAWRLNERSTDRWLLWTTEEDIEAKRSGGAVLASPVVAADRDRPDAGAPALHCLIDDLPPGLYRIYISNPGRPLGYSRDGLTWFRHGGGELLWGQQRIDGPFEFWVDDRYAHPAGNPGPGYFDYVRFVRLPDSAANVIRIDSGFRDEAWLAEPGRRIVPASELRLDGFEVDQGVIRAGGPPAAFSHAFGAAGTYYVALRMVDDQDGIEELRIRLGEREVGTILADATGDARALFSLTVPLEVRAGEVLSFDCRSEVGFYRIESLLISTTPIEPPPLRFEHFIGRAIEPGSVQLCWTTTQAIETGQVELTGGREPIAGPPDLTVGRNHQAWLVGLDPRVAYQARVVTTVQGERVESPPFAVSARPARLARSRPTVIPLRVDEPTEQARTAWPAQVGLPFAAGVLADVAHLRLEAADGAALPLQADLFSRWPDGSVKWATLAFLADSDRDYRLRVLETLPPAVAAPLLTVTEGEEAWRLRTDALAFDLAKPIPALFSRVGFDRDGDGRIDDGERIAAAPLGANVKLELPDGAFYTLGPPEALLVEVNGPVRAVVRLHGSFVAPDGVRAWGYGLRLTLWRGQPQIEVALTVINDQPQPAFRDLRALALRVPLDAAGGLRGSLEGLAPEPIPDDDGLWIHQDFDNRFDLRLAEGVQDGERAIGVARAVDDGAQATVVLHDFWQTYPSGFAVKPDGVHVRLLPALPADQYLDVASREQWHILYSWCREGNYHLRAGQATQHRVTVRYDRPGAGPSPAALADWCNRPLLPQAPPEYLVGAGVYGRDLSLPGDGWESYEAAFAAGFERLEADRAQRRTYGWMHWGDWFGERVFNYGNSEYDLSQVMALHWLRSGDRRLFERGLEMARHQTTVDTLHGGFTEPMNGLVWTHSFNHVGSDLAPEDPRFPPEVAGYVEQFGRGFMNGAIDRQGHIYQEGNWLYAALTGDGWLRDVAARVSDNQARMLTRSFDFGIERSGGWPLINMVAAWRVSGDPFYLNAARLMVERCLERQDPVTGGWLHRPPLSETDGEEVLGGKAFAVGILSCGLLRYLDVEPEPRPEVERMLVRGADWLMHESWCPGRGFRYISNCAKYRDTGQRGSLSMLNAELIAFAWEQTGEAQYLDFWRDMAAGIFDSPFSGNGKSFSMAARQTIFGLDRVRAAGILAAPAP